MRNLNIIILGFLLYIFPVCGADQNRALVEISGNSALSKCKQVGFCLGILSVGGFVGAGVCYLKYLEDSSPLDQFPLGSGPIGSCNYIRFDDRLTISPVCSSLTRNSPGIDACPSHMKIKFGNDKDVSQSVCNQMKAQPCITDDEIKRDVPRWCRTHFGLKTLPQNKAQVQKLSNATRKHLQQFVHFSGSTCTAGYNSQKIMSTFLYL